MSSIRCPMRHDEPICTEMTTWSAGAPVPDHVAELLVRGRSADGSRLASVLGVAPLMDTPEVVSHLYDWPEVTTIRKVEAPT